MKNQTKNIKLSGLAGKNNYEEIKNRIKAKENVTIVPYIYNMEDVINLADLVVARSGAMTITEVAKCNKPAIFIPYPYATENHQEYNAKVLANVGAAKIILDKDLTKENLNKEICNIVGDKQELKEMSMNAAKVAINNVEEKIYNEIKELINNE